MIPKSSKPACDLRCSTAPELELECETCPGRNELKPMPGMKPLPRWRLMVKIWDEIIAEPWQTRGDLLLLAGDLWFLGDVFSAWIQYERNGDAR